MGRSGIKITKYIVFLLFIFLIFNDIRAVENPVKMRYACLNDVDSLVTLRWTNPTDICNSFVEHIIYGREDQFAPFVELDRIGNFVANQAVFKIPNLKLWEFYIETNFACNGIDSYFSDTIPIDKQEPSVWELDSISVDLFTQQVLIGWRHHPDTDREGYLVYHVDANNTIITNTSANSHIDSVVGQSALGQLNYSIAVYDSCKNASPISSGHKSVFLRAEVDSCTKEVTLKWTGYEGVNVNGYRVFQSIQETSGYTQISNVERNTLDHITDPLTPGGRFCFYIQMYSSGSPVITSSSNRVCIDIPDRFDGEIYFSRVSVTPENDSVDFSFLRDENHEYVELWDFTDSNLLLKTIKTDTIGDFYRFSLPIPELSNKVYDFRLVAKDNCGASYDSSFTANNILLRVNETNTQAELNWTSFISWAGDVERYQILKASGDFRPNRSTWNIIAEEGDFINDYWAFYEEEDFFRTTCFVIRAIENGPNQYDILDTVYSNTVCFIRDLIAYFPSALAPNSLVNNFKVVGVGIDYEKSSYEIYNRWGEKIWETKNGLDEWNGVDFRGKDAPPDVYVYKATIIGLLGEQKEYRGTVQLIR